MIILEENTFVALMRMLYLGGALGKKLHIQRKLMGCDEHDSQVRVRHRLIDISSL